MPAICVSVPVCLVHVRAYQPTAVDKQWGGSSWETYASQCRSPTVISQGHSTLGNYVIARTGIILYWSGERVSSRQEWTLPPVLCPDGKINTFNVSLCCTSTATALWHLVGFFQGETHEGHQPRTPTCAHTLLAEFLPRHTMWLRPDPTDLRTTSTVLPVL